MSISFLFFLPLLCSLSFRPSAPHYYSPSQHSIGQEMDAPNEEHSRPFWGYEPDISTECDEINSLEGCSNHQKAREPPGYTVHTPYAREILRMHKEVVAAREEYNIKYASLETRMEVRCIR